MASATQRRKTQEIQHKVRCEAKKVFSQVFKRIPEELLTEVTILIHDSGFISIKPKRLARVDWYRINRHIRNMGGIWVSNSSFSHWRLPYAYANPLQKYA